MFGALQQFGTGGLMQMLLNQQQQKVPAGFNPMQSPVPTVGQTLSPGGAQAPMASAAPNIPSPVGASLATAGNPMMQMMGNPLFGMGMNLMMQGQDNGQDRLAEMNNAIMKINQLAQWRQQMAQRGMR